MRHLISLINISERGNLIYLITYLTKLEGNYSNKGREKTYRTEEAYETYLPKKYIQGYFFNHLFYITFLTLLSIFQ